MDAKDRLAELRQLEIQILLEEGQRQLRDLLKDATVEPVEGGFLIHGYKSHRRAKPEDYWIPSFESLASEDFCVAHPFSDNAYRFVGEWLLER